jgi:ABC-type transport system substrate-binding protein
VGAGQPSDVQQEQELLADQSAHIDGMFATIRGDYAARVVQFESRAQDGIMTPPLGGLARLQKDATYQVITNPLSGAFYVAHNNTTLPPTDNKTLRLALNFAMNRKRFAETVMYGFVQPEVLLWKPTSPAFDRPRTARIRLTSTIQLPW